jgi:hypothetical protein
MSGDDDGAQPAREIKRGVRAVHVLGVLGTGAALALGAYGVIRWRPTAPIAEPAPIVTPKLPAYASLVREAGPIDPEPPPRLDLLHIRASAPVKEVLVGTRSVLMTAPAAHVSMILEPAEVTAPFKIEVIAVDGRRWSKASVSSKGLPIEVPFAGLPPGTVSACSDGQGATHNGSLLDIQDGKDVRIPRMHALVDTRGKFYVWRSAGRSAGTFAGTYSGEGLKRIEETARVPLPKIFPTKHARPSTIRRLVANNTFARFTEGDELPSPWAALLDATSGLTDVAQETPWAAVGIDVSRDGKSARLVQRGCRPVRVNLMKADMRVALESSSNGQAAKSWTVPTNGFGTDVIFDLPPGASHALPFVTGFEPAAGERVVVQLKAEMLWNFYEGARADWVPIEIEGASAL